MSLAEQINTLELDHAAALAKIANQDSTIETLTLSLAAMTREKLVLEDRIVEYQKHESDTIASVETLANAALDMVRVAQRPAGMPAEIIRFAPKSIRTGQAERVANLAGVTADGAILPDFSGGVDKAASPYWKNTVIETPAFDGAGLLGDDPINKPLTSGEEAEIVQGDSGDEQPESFPINIVSGKPDPRLAMTDEELGKHVDDTAAEAGETMTNDDRKAVIDRINAMKPTPMPINFVQAGLMHVEHDDEGLPIFLQRDTVFDRRQAQVFG